jgi:four helix bundle protein
MIIWQKSTLLTKEVFRLTGKLPSAYKYSLKDQMERAALSITNNIAEGSGRIFRKEKRRFYSISQGSLLEVVNMLLLVKGLGIIDRNEVKKSLGITEELSKMLYTIIKNIS